MGTLMRTPRRDRCAEILDLIDRCLADIEGDPSARSARPAIPMRDPVT
jgi:hypothetical protein